MFSSNLSVAWKMRPKAIYDPKIQALNMKVRLVRLVCNAKRNLKFLICHIQTVTSFSGHQL